MPSEADIAARIGDGREGAKSHGRERHMTKHPAIPCSSDGGETMKFFVKQTYTDKGHTKCVLLTAEAAQEQGYYHGYRDEGQYCGTYVDGFNTRPQAMAFLHECKMQGAQTWPR
jgi:hypothetical protein